MADLKAFVDIVARDSASRELANISNAFDILGNRAHLSGLEVGSGIANISNAFDNLGKRAHLSGLAVGAGLTAAAVAIGAIGKAAFDLGIAFDSAFDRIRVGTGKTGEALEGLQDSFKNVAVGVPSALEDVATAITEVSRRTGQTGDSLEGLATQFLDLSRITGTDLSENIRLTTRLFGDWGVAIEDQATTLDKLFRATQKTGVALSSLQQLLVQYGAPLRQLGFGLNETIALLAKFEAEGVNTELVLGSMRIAIGNLAEAGIPLREGFVEIQRVIRDAATDAEATGIAMKIFGARAGADMAAAIREGRFAVDELAAAIETGGETIATAATETEDAQERMARAFNQMKVAAEPAASAVFVIAGAVAESLAKAITEVTPDLTEFIKKLNPEMGTAAKEAGAGVSGMTTFIGDLITVVRTASTAIGIMNSVIQDTNARTEGLLTNIAAVIPGLGAGLAAVNATRIALNAARQDIERPLGPTLAELQEGALERTRTGSPGGRLAPRTVDEGAPGVGVTAAGPHPIVEQTTDAISEAQRIIDQSRVDISALLKPPGGADARGGGRSRGAAAGKEVAETAIDGFLDGLQAGEANAQAAFGNLGGKLATALNTALASNSKSGGAAVSRALEDVVTALEQSGAEDWRQLGDQLSDALHDALVNGTPENVAAAQEMIRQMSARVDEAQFWQKWGEAGKSAADKINVALTDTATKIGDAYADASRRIRDVFSNLRIGSELDEARRRVEEIVEGVRQIQDTARQRTQQEREGRDQATARLRQDADAQIALERRLAEIRKAGGPNVGADLRQARQDFERERNRTIEERSRQDADLRLRRADATQDRNQAQRDSAELASVQKVAERDRGLTPQQQAERRAFEEATGIVQSSRDAAAKANADLLTAIAAVEKVKLEKWDELVGKSGTIRMNAEATAAALGTSPGAVLDVASEINLLDEETIKVNLDVVPPDIELAPLRLDLDRVPLDEWNEVVTDSGIIQANMANISLAPWDALLERSNLIRANWETISALQRGEELPPTQGNGGLGGGRSVSRETTIVNYGIMPSATELVGLVAEREQQTEQLAVATQGA